MPVRWKGSSEREEPLPALSISDKTVPSYPSSAHRPSGRWACSNPGAVEGFGQCPVQARISAQASLGKKS